MCVQYVQKQSPETLLKKLFLKILLISQENIRFGVSFNNFIKKRLQGLQLY